MTGLLTAAAVIATMMLLVSATHTGSKATQSDNFTRGAWGIAYWHRQRNRPLDPHERRWQTALLSGRDNDSRWRDLAEEIQALAHTSGASGIGPAPEGFHASWIDAAINNLEETINRRDPAGDQT